MSTEKNAAEYRDALNQSAQLLGQNRPGDALRALEPYYDADPTDPDIAINVGGAYILQRKWDKAVKVLSKATDAHPENAMLWTNLGAAQLGSLETAGPQQQARAIAAYERALQNDPLAPNVHYHLGLIYKERGELVRAAAFFQRALEVNPADLDAAQWLERLDRIMAEERREHVQQKLDGDSSASTDIVSPDLSEDE